MAQENLVVSVPFGLRHRTVLLGAALAAGAAAVVGCVPPKPVATPADLQRLGTRSYPDRDRAEVVQAAVTALKVLGYEIVTTEPRVRTSPKEVHVTATGNYAGGSTSAQTYVETVAWDIDVEAGASGGCTLHAQPRAAVNGIAMDQVYVDWADRTFGELMKEIDASLPAKHP